MMFGAFACARELSILSILQLAATRAAAIPFTAFRYEHQAQRHCPHGTVMWVDFKKRKYYSKGQTLYGRGLNGSYGCLGRRAAASIVTR
jgi:hypothetical protein